VRDLAHTGTPLYGIKERMLRDLHPNVIITQSLCEVCAVHEGDVRALAAAISPPPVVVTLGATTLDEVFADIERVAVALGLTDESEELIDGLRDRLRRVHETLKAAQAPRPRVAVVEWGDPIFTGGHWVPEMIKKAGGIDVIGTAGEVSKTITLAQLQASAPDLLVVAPCGYNLSRAIDEGRRLLALDEWAWARDIPVWALDANSYASRPGPRLVEGTEILARLFNPSLFTPLDPSHAVRIN
jgi:iron complex transport system substrate-binding protein